MRCFIIMKIQDEYFLFCDADAVVHTFEMLWQAHKMFLDTYLSAFGFPFEYYDGIRRRQGVPIHPSLVWSESARSIRKHLVANRAQLLEVKGTGGILYGVTTLPKGQEVWEAGQRYQFWGLENEIRRKGK